MAQATFVKTSVLSTLQDLGRTDFEHLGVRVGGVMDTFAAGVANRLVGNGRECALVESTFGGDKIVFNEPVQIAVTGAEVDVLINGVRHPSWAQVTINAGDELCLGFARHGVRAYLAVKGGWQCAPVLGSRSADLAEALEEASLRPLSAGQSLDFLPSAAHEWTGQSYPVSRREELYQVNAQTKRVRVLKGPESTRVNRAFLRQFERLVFAVGKESNRQALTLDLESDAPGALSEKGADIVSSYTAFGTIQVPAHGRLTVLMADRQSTGGFIRLGQVIAADLPVLSQARQGDRLGFSWVSLEEARSLAAYVDSMVYHAHLTSPFA